MNDQVDLEQFDEIFSTTEVKEKDEYDEVPDGKYQVVVDAVELTNAKNSGYPMLKWTLKILGPRFKGRIIWKYRVLNDKEKVRWLKEELSTCGLNLSRLSDLKANLTRLLDVQLEISKSTKGDFSNIYFNRRIETNRQPQISPTNDQFDDLPF